MIKILSSSCKTSDDIIHDILKIENEVYTEDMRGDFESIKARFNKYPEMFFLAYDEDKKVGYFCYFPISQKLYEEIVYDKAFRDGDIKSEDIVSIEETSHIYALSIAIYKNYQNMGIGKAIMKKFDDFIKMKCSEGCKIKDIVATVVSSDGEKCAKQNGFQLCHDMWREKSYKIYKKNI